MEPAVYVFVGQGGLNYGTLRNRAIAVEDCGYDGLWLVDHFWARDRPDADFLDGWTTIAGLAEATDRLRLGVLVTCNAFRNPGILAKVAATADHISDGRIELGMGAGWMDEEFDAYGFDFAPVGERLDALGESLEILTRLFSEKRTSFEGDHYRIRNAPFFPKPVQSPLPITIGGAGRQVMLRLVARHANRWNCPIPAAPEIASLVATLHDHCREIGRDAAEITVSEQVAVVLGKDEADYRNKREVAEDRVGGFIEDIDAMAVCGTPSKVADELNAKIASGVADFAVIFGDLGERDTLELFASHVAPQLTG